MIIGKYEISILNTGTFALDGGAMFGIIPKPLWSRSYPSDDKNRIKLAAKSLLLESENKKILIDTGMGSDWNEKQRGIYDIEQSESNLRKSLMRRNLQPEDITDVILTHLHFDHTGGAVKNESGKLTPAFPNARYHIRKKQFEWAENPSQRDGGSFIRDKFIPLAEHGVLYFTGDRFDDEIELPEMNGHTFSQQIVKISDSSDTFIYCGDLIPTAAHIPIPYVMGYDLQPLVTVKEKELLLKNAYENNWKLIFEHDAYRDAAEVALINNKFTAGKIIDFGG